MFGYTTRQIELFYREAVAEDHRGRADRIEDTGLGMAGRAALGIVRKLRGR